MKDPTAVQYTSVESLMGDIAEEFIARLNRGEEPQIEEYAARDPQLADAIRLVLPAILEARAATSQSSATQRFRSLGRQFEGQLGDYRIIREVGRGGMGVVYEAEQVSLGRRVALKVLPFAAVLDAKQLQRFKNEAQAAAHLTHQNIVPVHSVGCERGVHYYAMQFIDGSTLGDVIHELRECAAAPRSVAPPRPTSDAENAPDSAAAQLPDEPVAANGSSAALDAFAPDRSTKSPAFFRSVANLGVQAAEALEHAHEFGVVHRDIKPSNLLLDQRGNLWITDFGLARLETDASLTLTGDVLGTLRYMSPEQAAGKNLLLDHRTDIYSLGVTLYELLTLKPAIDGRDRQELLRKIADQDPRPPRRLNPAIPADLETILLKATAKEPQRRYASAKELARDLDRFLEDKPIRAKRPTLAERAAKWSRRHRHLVASAVVVLVVAVSALSISTVLLAQKQAEIVRQRNAARVQSTRAEAARERAEKRQKETEQVVAFQASMLSGIDVEAMGPRIKELLREQVRAALERQYVGEFPDSRKRTPEEVEAELAAFDQRADAAQALDVARRVMDEFVLARAVVALEEQFTEQPLVRARLHSALGRTYRGLGLPSAAETQFRAALEIRQRELGAEHPDTLTSISSFGYVLWVQGRLAEAEPYYREALEGRRRVLGNEHPLTMSSINDMGELLVDSRPAEAEPYYREALESRRRVLGDEHRDTVISIHNMGYLLQAQGKLTDAEPYYREALEKARRVSGDKHLGTLIHNMGFLLSALGRLTEAEAYYREALAIGRWTSGDEHMMVTINNLGHVLKSQGRLTEAEPYYREVLEQCRRILGDDHPNTLKTIHGMGSLLQKQGNLAEADAYFRESLDMSRRTLGDEHPITLTAMHKLGFVLQAQGKPDEAEPYSRAALETRRRVLGNEHPHTLISINRMGMLLRDLGRLSEAESLFADGTRAARAGLGDHPTTGAIEHHYADVLREAGRVDEAIDLARTAVDQYRAHPDWPPDEAAHAREVLAEALLDVGDQAFLEQAEEAVRKSLEIRRTVLPEDHPRVWRRYNAMSMLGDTLVRQASEPSLAVEARMEKLREAEPLLVESGGWLTRNADRIPQHIRDKRLRRVLERIVELYEVWNTVAPDTGKAERAAEWRTELEKLDGS